MTLPLDSIQSMELSKRH